MVILKWALQTERFIYLYIFRIYTMKRIIDAKVRKVGNSYVITVPMETAKRFRLRVGDLLEVYIKKPII